MFWISGNIIISDDFGYFWMNNISKESDESLGRDGGMWSRHLLLEGQELEFYAHLDVTSHHVASRRRVDTGSVEPMNLHEFWFQYVSISLAECQQIQFQQL